MSLNHQQEELNKSLSLLDVMPGVTKEASKEQTLLNRFHSSDILPLRPEKGKKSKAIYRPIEHNQHAYGRPDEWVGSRRKATRSWKPKSSGNSSLLNDSCHSAPATFQSRPLKTAPVSNKLEKKNDDPLNAQSLHESSLNDSMNFQGLVISTKKDTAASSIDGSLHSVLTEDSSSSNFKDVLNMWNNSCGSLGPSIVEEDSDEDASSSSQSMAFSLSYTSKPNDRKKFASSNSKASSPSLISSSRWKTPVKDTKPCVPELEESLVSFTESSDSVTLKSSSATADRGLRPNENLPLKPTRSKYHKSASSNSSVVSSASYDSKSHAHRGHNRPDDWIGGYTKTSKRSWRVKNSSSETAK